MKKIEIEVRRHNGQCAYGLWMRGTDPDVPPHVAQAVEDEIAESDSESGQIQIGGQHWAWRKILHCGFGGCVWEGPPEELSTHEEQH